MKRIGNLYEKIYDIDNLRLAHKNARKGKSWYKEVKMVDDNEDYYLTKLQEMLINCEYKTSEYKISTIIDKNKEREIYKLPYFPDRICQWAILQIIEKYILRQFTKDTYSAIPNRGIHLALKRVNNAMNNDSCNTKYCLKMDVSKYYPSINQNVLYGQLCRIFKDEKLILLLKEIINSTDKGVPIGNYLSQWFGNLYLSKFAHWLKEDKKVKHLFIYMDDIVILDGDKKFLHELRKEIENYLKNELKLTIKKNYTVFDTKQGVDFVGYRVFEGYVLLRKSTIKSIKSRCRKINYKISNKIELSKNDYFSINSYEGWLKWCNSTRFRNKYILPIKPHLNRYYKKHIIGGIL